jgi:hypothetical protein
MILVFLVTAPERGGFLLYIGEFSKDQEMLLRIAYDF